MRYYIAYSFFWNNLEKLKEKLEKISLILEKTKKETFIFFRDIQKWWENRINEDKVMEIALKELEKSDAIFVFIENEKISEWKSIEIWFAKALNKEIILFVKKWLNLRLSKYLANKVIYFENIEDLETEFSLN